MKNIYINWASYDELSDNIELTEELAMYQLKNLIRLRKNGVSMDYYLMDAFWYDPDSGFMKWRKPHWKKGPERWLKECRKNGILPGLWLPTNKISTGKNHVFKEWQSSLCRGEYAYCLFKGNFLEGLIKVMDYWYSKGVRLYKFDFADFDAATDDALNSLLPDEIRLANQIALRTALCEFRRKHPDCIMLAYNGFGGQMHNTSLSFRKTVDHRWLDCFDAMYCGDPRPADLPCVNFWRSKDIYSDHMLREFYQNGIPLERIDNSAFMIGKTGTCYGRGKQAWKAMLLLALSKGSHFNTYYGNLELLSDEDAKWMAKAQKLFFSATEYSGNTKLIGGIPGKGEIYGYLSGKGENLLLSIVNPSQDFTEIKSEISNLLSIKNKRIIFHDKGFTPQIKNQSLILGPEQFCILAFGSFASDKNNLGIEEDVIIPQSSKKINAKIAKREYNSITAVLKNLTPCKIRAIFTQSQNGIAIRTSGGSPPNGKKLGELLKIEVRANNSRIPVSINYDKAIWSGLSWAAGEFNLSKKYEKVEVTASSSENKKLDLNLYLYMVSY